MRRFWIVLISLCSAITAALLAASTHYVENPTSTGLGATLASLQIHLVWAALALAVTTAGTDAFRTYFGNRHQAKPFILRKVNNFARRHLTDRERHNRLTVLKVTRGSRIWCSAYLNPLNWAQLKREPLLRAKLSQVRFFEKYLWAYVRSNGAVHPFTTTPWLISDRIGHSHGFCGLAWDAPSGIHWSKADIGVPNPDLVAHATKWDEIQDEPALGFSTLTYCKNTGVRTLHELKSITQLPKRMGAVVIRRNGAHWGVLIVDSCDDENLFETDSDPQKAFWHLALSIGEVV